MKKVEAYFDGACHNTGNKVMGIGLHYKYGGETFYEAMNAGIGTSNLAEWSALYRLLVRLKERLSTEHGVLVNIKGDSQLIINQFAGNYRTKGHNLMILHQASKELVVDFENRQHRINAQWIRRDSNTTADLLSKKGLELGFGKYSKSNDMERVINLPF